MDPQLTHYLVYVSTKEPVQECRSPWNVVYKTNLRTGETERLTPPGTFDLSPSVSPSGKKVAVASFQGKRWDGEIKDLKINIYVMSLENPSMERKRVIENGGWPSWGSENVIFFHRKVGDIWGVFQYNLSTSETIRVTPEAFDAVTPAAIDETRIAVATIRQKSEFTDVRTETQYRHIEIFDMNTPEQPLQITQNTRAKADHFNPFVMDGGKYIGYHRCKSDLLQTNGPDSIFSPVWNQKKDILYVCMGPSFKANETLEIHAIPDVSNAARIRRQPRLLTKGKFNNAFPFTNPDGTKFVFRSTRDGGDKNYQNLYIMEDAEYGEVGGGEVTRLTEGNWIDTHCQWSPNGNLIVFASNRDKPTNAPERDHGLDPGYFAVYLMSVSDRSVVRVIRSEYDLSGHVNHPVFSPDGRSIAVTSDLAAVSADPMSLPTFLHSVRPYGDIFSVDIDPDDIEKNKDMERFVRVTHSRYENSTPAWTVFSTHDPHAQWNLLVMEDEYTPACPYAHPDGGESWHMTGQICIPKRHC
nr:tol-Pal system protein TolB-like isoform X2 [Setaria viridis]